MSSNKQLSLEYHLQGKNNNRQKQSGLRQGIISGASSYATVDDDKYYEYISEKMREVENRGDEKINKLKKSMEEYISEKMKEVENRFDEKINKLKKSMEEYNSEHMEKTENDGNEEIKNLKKRAEEFMKDDRKHSKDRKSRTLRSEAKQLRHEMVDRSLLNEKEMTMENQTTEDQCYDGSTKIRCARENGKMTSEYIPANRGHLAMEVAEQPLTHPPTVQAAMSMGMRREICAQECYDESIKTPVDSPRNSKISGPTPVSRRHRSMETTKQSVNHPSTHQNALRIGSEITAKAFNDDRIKTQTDSPKDSTVSGHTPLNRSHPAMEVTEENTLEPDSPRRLCVLLLGSSGNGKSSIGNSILGKDVFRTSSSVKGLTPCIAMDSAQVGDQIVQVVDGPSILDSKDADQDFREQIVIAMETSLTLCDYAFSAIVIVLRFGVRFTKREVNTIKLIKSVLGENVIRDYGICAVTCGDNFEHAVEEAREDGELLTFEGWCHEQTGEVKALFEECGFRCVLFNNRTKDENTKNAQRLAFLKMLNPVKSYSKEEFLKAQTSLDDVIGTERLITDLEEETQKIVDNTRRDMEDLSEEVSLEHMDSLLQHLTDQQAILRELGLSSPKLRELMISMQLLDNQIRSKIRKRNLVDDNLSFITPLSRSNSSPASHQRTPPSSTYGDCDQVLLSDGYASGMGTESRNMCYTSSVDDWNIVQMYYSPLPTVHGHSEVTTSGWLTVLKHFWKYIRLSTRKVYTH